MIYDDYAARCGTGHDIADHMPRLFAEASIGDAIIIELGVRSGNSTAAFLAGVEQAGGHVYSVDIVTPRTPPAWLSSGLWTLHVGDDLTFADQLPDGVDVVFIDTSHTFDQTLAELNLYAPKVRPGGVVVLHDSELAHPEASPATDPPYPVAEAIRTWADGRPVTVEWVSGCHGLAVIHVGKDGL